jgi:hypothetical protein
LPEFVKGTTLKVDVWWKEREKKSNDSQMSRVLKKGFLIGEEWVDWFD